MEERKESRWGEEQVPHRLRRDTVMDTMEPLPMATVHKMEPIAITRQSMDTPRGILMGVDKIDLSTHPEGLSIQRATAPHRGRMGLTQTLWTPPLCQRTLPPLPSCCPHILGTMKVTKKGDIYRNLISLKKSIVFWTWTKFDSASLFAPLLFLPIPVWDSQNNFIYVWALTCAYMEIELWIKEHLSICCHLYFL